MIILIAIAIGTFIATLIGGLTALRLKDKLHLILGFSAGAVIAVAFFDLLPESIELGKQYFNTSSVTSFVALGFIIYLILDRVMFLHSHNDNFDSHVDHNSSQDHRLVHGNLRRGILGAGSFSVHSFLDGVAIGLSFQISMAVGAIVAVAVLIHDFSDGINTVNLILKNEGHEKNAFRWLFVDALAPVVGVCSTFLFTLPEQALSVVLALFSGFFLYIGASDLIPESHHAHPKLLTTALTICGAAILYIAIRLINI